MSSKAPRRMIERSRTNVAQAFTTGETSIDIRTAKKAETLIRTIADIYVWWSASLTTGTSIERWMLILGIAPRGVNIVSTGSAAALALNTPLEEVSSQMGGGRASEINSASQWPQRWQLDTQAQRKMKTDDKYQLSLIATDTGLQMAGTIYTWYKQ